jgi:hypothetical protein
MCGRFGNCIYCVLYYFYCDFYCFFYVYLFLIVCVWISLRTAAPE